MNFIKNHGSLYFKNKSLVHLLSTFKSFCRHVFSLFFLLHEIPFQRRLSNIFSWIKMHLYVTVQSIYFDYFNGTISNYICPSRFSWNMRKACNNLTIFFEVLIILSISWFHKVRLNWSSRLWKYICRKLVLVLTRLGFYQMLLVSLKPKIILCQTLRKNYLQQPCKVNSW
jgi:hypothetical protein